MSALGAVPLLAWTLGWAGGRVPVYVDGELATTIRAPGIVRAGEQLVERTIRWDMEHNAEVALGLPRGSGSTVLWAWVTGTEQVGYARRFRPLPSIALGFGRSSKRLLLWALSEAVPHILAEHGNKKLAYALHAPQKPSDPATLRIPLPGTFIRRNRANPAAVLVTRATFEPVTREAVVGKLRDPPRPYMERLRAGEVNGRAPR